MQSIYKAQLRKNYRAGVQQNQMVNQQRAQSRQQTLPQEPPDFVVSSSRVPLSYPFDPKF